MTRQKSNHLVQILDVTVLINNATKMVVRSGIDMNDCVLATPYQWGIVKKNGKPYLINSEGVGSAIPLTEGTDKIEWFKDSIDENGNIISFSVYPIAHTTFYYGDLVHPSLLPKVLTDRYIPLHEFIRTFGDRLEVNFEVWEKFLSE